MPGLLANENFPLPAIHHLRGTGLDVLSIGEDSPGLHDEEVLAMARREARWLMTFDRDYGELVFNKGYLPPTAIIYIRQGPYPVVRVAEMILDLLQEPDKIDGFFVVVTGTAVRRRALPKPR